MDGGRKGGREVTMLLHRRTVLLSLVWPDV